MNSKCLYSLIHHIVELIYGGGLQRDCLSEDVKPLTNRPFAEFGEIKLVFLFDDHWSLSCYETVCCPFPFQSVRVSKITLYSVIAKGQDNIV